MHCGIPNAYNNSITKKNYYVWKVYSQSTLVELNTAATSFFVYLTFDGLKMTQESRNM
jgi:hypothetical protein